MTKTSDVKQEYDLTSVEHVMALVRLPGCAPEDAFGGNSNLMFENR